MDHGVTDNDRVPSIHMQPQRRIFAVKWYDKITNAAVNETTKLAIYLLSSLTDATQSLFKSDPGKLKPFLHDEASSTSWLRRVNTT